MTARREFLTTLFAALEAYGVRYCVMRNYDHLFTDTGTDVDLLVSRYSLARFTRCLRESASQTGFRFVQATRFVNHSHVYWHPEQGFIRVDFETEQRWRVFPALTAREVLDARRLHDGDFFVPHPKHESVILFLAALWRGGLSERYRDQLARLYAAGADRAGWRQIFCAAFGAAGDALLQFQSTLPAGQFDEGFCRSARRCLMRHALGGRRSFAVLRYAISDGLRLAQRLRRPPGLSLLLASASDREADFDAVLRQVEFLFPRSASVVHAPDLSRSGKSLDRPALRQRLQRLKVLFKGGLFFRACRLARDVDLPSVIRNQSRGLHANRAFIGMQDSSGNLYLGHVGTGFMVTHKAEAGARAPDFGRSFAGFTANILARTLHIRNAGLGNPAYKTGRTSVVGRVPSRGGLPTFQAECETGGLGPDPTLVSAGRRARGIFCVLVGLDGAGKTTLARNLCELAAAEPRVRGVRYFHWRPKVFKPAEFPLPEFQDLPRKSPAPRSLPNSALSALRLAKNILLARAAWLLRLRPLLHRSYVVLVDRYFYNYYLDPASVKYSGPASWLNWARQFFPQPDVVIKLHARPEILRQRKQELSEPEIARQAAVLEQLNFRPARVIAANASRPPEQLAREVLAAILNSNS